jgi:hypothetical protein
MSQLDLAFVQARRDDGIDRAAVHSGACWQDKALASVRNYAQSHREFLTEDVRFDASQLDTPTDGRAWGHVMRRAVKAGWIVRTDRCKPAKSSNLSPKPLWESLIFGKVVVTEGDFDGE